VLYTPSLAVWMYTRKPASFTHGAYSTDALIWLFVLIAYWLVFMYAWKPVEHNDCRPACTTHLGPVRHGDRCMCYPSPLTCYQVSNAIVTTMVVGFIKGQFWLWDHKNDGHNYFNK